ncbi:MFS general substrate transporter [Atractiella rhizophila]|nr:MFS general substrate transporter [Atractiella rhizophila]
MAVSTRRQDEESQPLLTGLRKTTPLPFAQLFVLCSMRLTEPVSATVLQPFINKMIEESGVTDDPKKVGYYAGIITSLFAASQLLTVFSWGRLSDRIGRKPVLLTGLSGVLISTFLFGLQKSFVGMVIARCISGAMNGNVAVIKSVLAEITDESNQARAFTLLPLCFAVGSIIGPLAGGYLAHPTDQWPRLFGSIDLFQRHPYFLPCFIASLLNLFAILMGAFFLKETLPRKPQTKGASPNVSRGHDGDVEEVIEEDVIVDPEITKAARRYTFRDLLTKHILAVLFTFGLIVLFNNSYFILLPLFAYTPIQSGGLSFSTQEIGNAMSIAGIVAIVVQTLIFPPLQLRFGSLRLLRGALALFPFIFICFPFLNGIARWQHKEDAPPGHELTIWIGLIAMIGIKAFANLSTVCITLMINNSAPERSALGAINGAAQTFACLARTIGPVAVTSLFAISASRNVLGGNLVWIVLTVSAVGMCAMTFRLKEVKPAWRNEGK